MRPKVAEQVPEKTWQVFAEIRAVLEALPEMIEFPTFIMGIRVNPDLAVSRGIPSCHVVAHAFARFFPVNVHDGYVMVMGPDEKVRKLEHSWLTLHDSNPSIIIDPWPLGTATGPAIFIQDYAYHFGPECSFLSHKGEEFETQVEALSASIARIMEGADVCAA